MKEIPIRNTPKKLLVDDADFHYLSRFNWRLRSVESNFYVETSIQGRYIQVHNLLLPSPIKSLTPDHIDGNGLNNQRYNLRLATKQQQMMNRFKTDSDCSSRYKGVFYARDRKKWRANLKLNGKKIDLGTFLNENDAALAYNRAALKYFGEFAKVNIIEELQ